jgi:hypothetical protein
MTWVATAVIGSTAVGLYSANKAAGAQSDAANQAADVSQSQYNQTREDQAPYRAAGVNALNQMQRTAGNVPSAFAYDNKGMPGAFSFDNAAMFRDPGYAFRLSEGQKALDRTAAARGGLMSGGALKAATRYGQDMGSQEYTNAFNRALTSYNTDVNRENQLYGRALTGYNSGVASENQLYNRQAALAGIGQTSTNYTNSAGAANAANVGNAVGAAGQANASGYMGQANAVGQGVSQYMNYTNNNNLLSALQRNQGMQLVNSGGFSNTPSYMVNPG